MSVNNDKAVTHLLDLPNELFPDLLIYLSAGEILKAFLELSERNSRLAALIGSFLSYTNLSHQSNFWLTTRLPKFREIIYSACVTTRQLLYLRDLPSLETLKVVEIHSTNGLDTALRVLGTRSPKLYSLKLNFTLKNDSYHLTNNFDIPLEELDLSFRCSFTPTGSMVDSLRHLTLRLNGMRDLFQLGQQLPMIESLLAYVNRSVYWISESVEQFDSFTIISPHLKRVGLYSREYEPRYRYEFEYFEKFVHGCSSSLEYLILDLILLNQPNASTRFHSTKIVDGDRLEQGMIAVLPHLKKFEFRFEFEIPVKFIEKYQNSFANELWRQRCIVIDYSVSETLPGSDTTTMSVFSIIDTATVFEQLSIDSSRIANWHSNISLAVYHSRIRLTTVRSITILPSNNQAILTLDLFIWIATSFPRLRRLELVQGTHWQLEDESVSYPKLKSIQVLCFRREFSFQLIRRFLLMCPRVKHLQLSKASLKKMFTEPNVRRDLYLKSIYHQIVAIELNGSSDVFDFQQQLHDFFPLAKLI
ncbi:unnamed protein product [Rotaria socialis]|uniref:F-box domain-containing protein n=1 Tax=Rotaria socialis TaxID=392032 RepID=A0A818E9E1_9BILA|nr:unnamed protein product [Rotaria socialis]CAF3369317.1 unnamed protein product [Rotaria socialis]CAF3446779.1 unnamed protein product [Rotaria socialis]CAF4417153.1 unnamed protein product [Rotaria socialis]CAF4525801.1 unnamed protein product [Rotaria socialis]